MALTQSAWTNTIVEGRLISTCTVLPTTGETDAYTLATSTALNPTKKFLLIYEAAVAPNGEAMPLDLWLGWSISSALSGQDAAVLGTDAVYYKKLFDDIVSAISPVSLSFVLDPTLTVADVVTIAAVTSHPKCLVPVAPYYIFNLNGGSALVATTSKFTIIQDLS